MPMRWRQRVSSSRMMILCLIFSRVLDADYNGLVENVSSRIDLISLSNLFAQLLAVEAGIKI
jgi:hypothetical protein